MVELTDAAIDTSAMLESVQSDQSGAVLLFLGTVREMTQGRQTLRLTYDAYPAMAMAKMEELEREALEQWPLNGVRICHRVGQLELGDVSVAIAVSSPHREDAFQAGRWLIDALKERVPIWKQEHWADGTTEWVHPMPERKKSV